MFLPLADLRKESLVKDIVMADYRTAAVFREFGIGYCCGASWTLEATCLMNNIDPGKLLEELRRAMRPGQTSCPIQFDEWDIPFLIQYIKKVHHYYLTQTLPELSLLLGHFVTEHEKKYPRLKLVHLQFEKLYRQVIPHLQQEESVIFPYINQLNNAFLEKNSYGNLFVKTLGKPIGGLMADEHHIVASSLQIFRLHTNNYTVPASGACTSHTVVFARLKELDNDLAQHLYLENQILFPRALEMERQLLAQIQ